MQKHVSNLSRQSLDHWTHSQNPVDTFESIIQYFDRAFRKDELSQKHMRELSQISLIPIGSRLLKPSRLYMQMEEDLAPFMFKVKNCLFFCFVFFLFYFAFL